jgi:predicted small metal-binding protein
LWKFFASKAEGNMAKTYLINCRDAGVECDFQARGPDVEAVIEQCAAHAVSQHNMHAFSPQLYAKMRSCLKVVEEQDAKPA